MVPVGRCKLFLNFLEDLGIFHEGRLVEIFLLKKNKKTKKQKFKPAPPKKTNMYKHQKNLGAHALIASLVKRHLLLQKLCLGSGSGLWLECRVFSGSGVRVWVRGA